MYTVSWKLHNTLESCIIPDNLDEETEAERGQNLLKDTPTKSDRTRILTLDCLTSKAIEVSVSFKGLAGISRDLKLWRCYLRLFSS